MTLLKHTLGALFALVTAHAAQAAVIPTVNGFVPLQYTKNLSIAEFLSGVGGWNESYHLASHDEITSLLATYRIAPHPATPWTQSEFAFIRDIGGHDLGPYGTYFADGNQAAIGRSLTDFVSVNMTNGENTQPYQNCPSFRECSSPTIRYEAQSYTYKDDYSGLFLVVGAAAPEGTDVPEPASLALMGLGLGTLLLRRRS